MDKIVAIHQPNFFPWLGFFDKIEKSDTFIFMDNVQFPKSSKGSWTNRVKFLINNEAKWFTVPVNREFSGIKNINEISMKNDDWKIKFQDMLFQNYKKSPYFNQYIDFVLELCFDEEIRLSRYNSNSIINICKLLDIDTCKIVLGSDIKTKYNSTDLLIEMVNKVDGTIYLCGGGASGYQEDTKFNNASIGLKYQNFEHINYVQYGNNSISGLSILDILFFSGRDNLIKFLKRK